MSCAQSRRSPATLLACIFDQPLELKLIKNGCWLTNSSDYSCSSTTTNRLFVLMIFSLSHKRISVNGTTLRAARLKSAEILDSFGKSKNWNLPKHVHSPSFDITREITLAHKSYSNFYYVFPALARNTKFSNIGARANIRARSQESRADIGVACMYLTSSWMLYTDIHIYRNKYTDVRLDLRRTVYWLVYEPRSVVISARNTKRKSRWKQGKMKKKNRSEFSNKSSESIFIEKYTNFISFAPLGWTEMPLKSGKGEEKMK